MSNIEFPCWKKVLIPEEDCCRIMETAPTLPDFALALKPDEYQLPHVDASWDDETYRQGTA